MAVHTVTATVRATTGGPGLAVGIVACLQTHGSRANWHPHLDVVVTDGASGPRAVHFSATMGAGIMPFTR